MSVLADKIRKSRESQVQAGGYTFTIRRPTDVDMLDLQKLDIPTRIRKIVVGWDGVTELDLIPGGDGSPAKFDSDACAEWVSDHIEWVVTISNSAVESYKSHKSKLGDAEKK